uniref:Uncharacterized protein n=1 Tax=Bionectria ochroleuca TaxID=29856 RepID=A0A8H7NHN3_BIOOC
MLSRAIPPPKKANLTPEYEVRLLLKPEIVLNPDHEPTSTVLSAFGMSPTSTLMNVQFLDTDSKDIYAAGWSVRIRKIENKSGIELTYKKRYNISSACIDTELTTANKDGFNADDGKYEAQVEWGILAQTLSISREKRQII